VRKFSNLYFFLINEVDKLRFSDYEKSVLEAKFSNAAKREYKEHKQNIYWSIFFLALGLFQFYPYTINYNFFYGAHEASVSQQIYYSSIFSLTTGLLCSGFGLIFLIYSSRKLGAVYEATYRELNSKYS